MALTKTLFNTLPHSRTTDPPTSFYAGDDNLYSGRKQKQAMAVLESLRQHAGSTSAELAQYMATDRFVAARRLPDLEKLGLATRGPIRICRACGRRCVTWKAKDNERTHYE